MLTCFPQSARVKHCYINIVHLIHCRVYEDHTEYLGLKI